MSFCDWFSCVCDFFFNFPKRNGKVIDLFVKSFIFPLFLLLVINKLLEGILNSLGNIYLPTPISMNTF